MTLLNASFSQFDTFLESFSPFVDPPLESAVELDSESGNDPFRELIGLLSDHERLVSELADLRVKLNRASGRLKSELVASKLAKANFDRLKSKHSAMLTELRANRLLARRFLQKIDGEPASS